MNKSKKVMKNRRKDHLDLMIRTQQQVTKVKNYKKDSMAQQCTFQMKTSDNPLFLLLPKRNCKELFNHMVKKKMTDKKFTDTHRVSNLPTLPGARRWRRRRTGTRRRRRTSLRWSRGLTPRHGRTTPCHREPFLTGLKERKTL